jgi:hypothetical protein
MATLTEKLTETSAMATPTHDFHAEAHALFGDLQRPVVQKIEKHIPVALSGRNSAHLTRFVEDVSIEGLISLKRGHTRVSGSQSLKHGGWVTLSTSILEGLNVFEIVTADRLVSQVSTDHHLENGHFPHVSFIGTQFTNMKVSGFPLELTLDFGLCGNKGNKVEDDISYLDNRAFLGRVKEQTEAICNAEGLPENLQKEYGARLKGINSLIENCGKQGRPLSSITCSIVTKIGAIPIAGVRSFGHVLVIPEFGTVSLGEVEIGEKMYDGSKRPDNYFTLTSFKMNLGCVGHGQLQGGGTTSNGAHNP